MKVVDEYRKFRGQCRELAAKITDLNDRRTMELMASAWDEVPNKHEAKLVT
jgi:hypothetical protein